MRLCEDCGSEIPEKRVLSMPKVRLCLDCQETLEKNGGHQRHKMEIYQGLAGWQLEEVKTIIIKGDE